MSNDVLLGIVVTLPIPVLCWLGGFKAARRAVSGSLTAGQHLLGLAFTVGSFYVLFLLAAFAPIPDEAAGTSRSGFDLFRALTFIFPIIGIAIGARGLAQFLLTRSK